MKRILLILTIIILLVFFSFLIYFLSTKKAGQNKNQNTVSPTPSVYRAFKITSTNPANGAVDVFPGEIAISFVTDTPITSEKDFNIRVTPPLQYSLKLTSTFPTQKVTYQVLGGLLRSTKYTVSVLNKNGEVASSWSFTTSDQLQESSSGLIKEQQDKDIKDFYPLFYDVPYSNDRFSTDYTGKLTLQVFIKQNDIENIKKEVNQWILQKGVNPATHTINYTNSF